MMIDIEYLLLLQRFREIIHDALTPFMEWISLFAVTYLVLIPIMYYWTCNKKDGLYVMGAYCYTVAINAVGDILPPPTLTLRGGGFSAKNANAFR